MNDRSRRDFLVDVGRGMITVSLGLAASSQLGFAAMPMQGPEALSFGELEPLVGLMIDTPVEKLAAVVAAKLRTGTSLKDLVAAAALANARTFGGEDYIGFHTMMAIAPSYRMALELPLAQQPLPVFKVLYRNTHRIQEYGGRAKEVLHPVAAAALPAGSTASEALRAAVRRKDLAAAEGIFAGLAAGGAEGAFDALLPTVQDYTEVHRANLPHRAWDLLDIIGKQHAHVLLRQSVHYCVQSEARMSDRANEVRAVLPKALDQHKLAGRTPGKRAADDAWVERMSQLIFGATPAVAADAVAGALAEGFAPDAVGEAIALAANQLLLRDHGRTDKEVQAGKAAGSVHGDSIGVHACDSANAWRGMARSAPNTFASLILGGYQAAYDRSNRGGDFLNWPPQPHAEDLAKLPPTKDPADVLRLASEAIRAGDQVGACALVHRYGELGHDAGPVLDLLRSFAISEDGALHAEKYYRTATEEFAAGRPAFRWRHLCALARVTASEFGHPAPGYAEACAALKA